MKTFLLIVLISSLFLDATVAEDSDTIFAPFVRNFRVAFKEPQVKLSWEDTIGLAKFFIVYRSEKEITQDNLSEATKVIELPSTETSYTDVPPKAGDWFYAVLIKDSESVTYEILLPYRNKSIVPVKIIKEPTIEDQSTRLTNIKAIPKSKTIDLSVQSSRNSRSVSLYRSTQAITDLKSLTQATLLYNTSGAELKYTDTPIPGVSYFYAFIDSQAFVEGNVLITTGSNSLGTPVELVLTPTELAGVKLPEARPIRSFPLPNLSQIFGNDQLPKKSNFDLGIVTEAKIQKILAQIPASTKKANLPSPKLLPSDKIGNSVSKGLQGNLQEILNKSFSNGLYSEALEKLQKLSTLGLQGELKIKTRYYSAVCQAVIGKKSEAILNFLSVRDELIEYVEPWITALLEDLK